MSSLIFCSFEVGGFPYAMAELLNRHGVRTLYVSLSGNASDHDSTRFHYGESDKEWDLSKDIQDCSDSEVVNRLSWIKREYGITHCFATGGKAHLLRKAGIAYQYWSYGADLDQDCFSPFIPAGQPLVDRVSTCLYYYRVVRWQQRRSLRRADAVMIAPYQYDALSRVCRGARLFFLPHYFKVMDLEALVERKKKARARLCSDLGADRYLFSASRHLWSGQSRERTDKKGNDIFIESFNLFLKRTGDRTTKLVLVEKGPDVAASKDLIKKKGIEDSVVWVGEMKRDDLAAYYQGATLCLGQFDTPVVAFSALEPLSHATPCVSYYGSPDKRVPYYRVLPPLWNSKDPEVIAGLIERLCGDDGYREDCSRRSWQWIKENCSEEAFVRAFTDAFQR